jgi:hypothetical protein
MPARLAYVAADGTPRIVPTWFEWTGDELVMATWVAGPHIRHPARRIRDLLARPSVTVSIDTDTEPPVVLQLRGVVTVTEVDAIVPEYASSARRYLGEEAANAMLAPLEGATVRMARIGLVPTWVSLIDFDVRLPSPISG